MFIGTSVGNSSISIYCYSSHYCFKATLISYSRRKQFCISSALGFPTAENTGLGTYLYGLRGCGAAATHSPPRIMRGCRPSNSPEEIGKTIQAGLYVSIARRFPNTNLIERRQMSDLGPETKKSQFRNCIFSGFTYFKSMCIAKLLRAADKP